MSAIKEHALVFVQDTIANTHNQYCANCRHFDRGPNRLLRECRALQGKASLLDCPALTAHFSPFLRRPS